MLPHTTIEIHRCSVSRVGHRRAFSAAVVGLILVLCFAGCSLESLRQEREERRTIERLRLVEIELPLPPDSILARYHIDDSSTFYQRYSPRVQYAGALIDSLNASLADSLRIDTLAIDYSLHDFGDAGRRKNILLLSSAYVVAYDNPAVLRSVIFHEFGHIAYDRLSQPAREQFEALWLLMQRNALLYLFRDGEYSGNARFGGHPEDNPSELYASAFNLLHNQSEEFYARLRFVDEVHLRAISEIAAMTYITFSFHE